MSAATCGVDLRVSNYGPQLFAIWHGAQRDRPRISLRSSGLRLLLEGVIADRAITSVVFAVYGRALARIAERWVVLGRPLDGHWPEFDESDVIRKAAHWIVAMDAKEHAEAAQWGDDPEVRSGEAQPASPEEKHT